MGCKVIRLGLREVDEEGTMVIKIVVPELGESVLEATVGEWLKKEGDSVKAGEPVVSLETDKVNLEVSAERAGVLARIERPAGADVHIGDILGTIAEAPAQPAPAGVAGFGEESAEPAGHVAETTTQAAAETGAAPAEAESEEKVTPVARRLAEERGVDLSQVHGSGPQGKVTKQDVEDYLAQPGHLAAAAVSAETPPEPTAAHAGLRLPPVGQAGAALQPAAPAVVASPSEGRREERVRMSRRRQTVARRLVEAQHTAAMLTTFNEVDMSAVIAIRGRRKESFKERHGVSLGFMSFFVKASIGALKSTPRLNAEIQGNEMILKHYYDIGIAVGAEEGLVVPVLRDADRMSFAEIEQAIKEYVRKIDEGALSLDDLRGGTFTITNGGVFGSLLSTPILNPPQVGILGLHKIEDRPIVADGQVVIRPMMYVALSYDHRIVDGREAVQFLVRVKELIEDPEALLLEG
jgi:2-oxoglutarate dehydrogenase E2 component (dihydrolipoamide succinyltransferase)